jgi:hypothetical protein
VKAKGRLQRSRISVNSFEEDRFLFLQGGIKMALSSVRKFGPLFAAVAALLVAGTALAISEGGPPLKNFPVAPRVSRIGGGLAPQADITQPSYPVFVTLCRQYDSRNFTPLLDNTARAVTLTGAPCSINSGAIAVSVNITVFNIFGQTANAVFKVGTVSPPTTAWINWAPGIGQIGNAGSLPLSAADQIFFQVNMGGGQLDFTIDVNAYYLDGTGTSRVTDGEFFGVYGNFGSALLFSQNNNTGGATQAIRGVNLGPGANSVGVLGDRFGTGLGFGVQGRLITSTTAAGAGVQGTAPGGTSSGPFGVYGVNTAVAGTIGVRGDGGLRGVDGVGIVSGSCGTCGEGFATTNSSGVSGFAGVAGADGVFASGNFSATGTKAFVEPYPGDATRQIAYIAIEGPTPSTFFTGRARALQGIAHIAVPDHFRAVTDPDGLTVQATPIGQMASFAILQVDLNDIVIQASKDVDFFYTVTGVRASFRDHNPVQENTTYRPDGKGGGGDIRLALSPAQIHTLIANQILNGDGTWNRATAEKLGWQVPENADRAKQPQPEPAAPRPDNKVD